MFIPYEVALEKSPIAAMKRWREMSSAAFPYPGLRLGMEMWRKAAILRDA